MPAGMNDFEREAPTDKGRKKRQRAVKIMDYLQDHQTPDQDIVQRIIALPAPVTELADPIRTKLDERAEVRRALLERRRAEKAAEATAKGGL
ncbi:hypothetical protein M433DRAFT_9248 [Acidomyces richmondensis BFW]|nr:hypothetical protein M433DRAFT_9248 [Acidomyces richmondensis BFW]